MCGIAGVLIRSNDRDRAGTSAADVETVKKLLGAIRHRGPDQFGVYNFAGRRASLGMGNARLSIIDLSGGQQPIANEDGDKWVVFNGEIFNYIELRHRLSKLGHRFKTQGDTEVIVHLYEEYGPKCLEHLNGQFAIAIWDEKNEELFLARDRLGIRPLFYTQLADRIVFGSEIKALLMHPSVSARIDPVALEQIFTFWSPVSPRTAFENIRSLPPGCWMIAKPSAAPSQNEKCRGQRDIEVQIGRYWRATFPPAGSEPYRNADEAAQQLRNLLIESTTLRLRADVPVGAYLSGGLDSSAITALIHRYTDNRLETFSIAFTDKAFDESEHQRRMARHLGTRHHLVTCTPADIGGVFPDMVYHAETPLLRTSPAPLYLLSQLVREHGLKVVLTGEGADEFLGGYNIFKEAKIRRHWARRPDSKTRPKLLAELYSYIGNMPNNAFLRKFFGQGLTDTGDPCYSHAIRWRNTARAMRFFSPFFREEIQNAHKRAGREDGKAAAEQIELPNDFDAWSPLAQAQFIEITLFLPEYLLSSQGDRMAMANSVEGRFPFLDHNVVEFCNELAPRLKLHGLDEKFILKRAVGDLLPESICSRNKQPYRAPIHASFFPDGKPLDWVADVLSTGQIEMSGYFEPHAVEGLKQKVTRGGKLGETDNMALAGILSTQLFHRQFITDFQTPRPLDAEDDVKYVSRGRCTRAR